MKNRVLRLNYTGITEMIARLIQNVRGGKFLLKRTSGVDWKRLLKLARNEVLGLDIGLSSVKIIQLRKDSSGYVVTAAGIVDIAASEDDNNLKETNIVSAICKCVESTGIQTRHAVCSVCGPEVAVRHFEFPLLPAEELEGAVLLEAEQICPFNIDDGAVDYQLIPDGEDKTSGILVAATNKAIERKSRFAKDASLNSVLIDVDGLALLNCFNEFEKPEAGRTTAILNVGSAFTNLAIMSDNGLPFVRDMVYAGNEIIKRIAEENNTSTETVRRILSGCQDSSEPRPSDGLGEPQLELGDSLGMACEKLIVDVSETLRYYAAQEKSTFVEKIFVCGGFALVKGFVELLDNRLDAAAVLWNPLEKMRCDGGRLCEDILRRNGPAMAVAAGLAMRLI